MVDLNKTPDPDPTPPIGSTVEGRAKAWVWTFMQILFACATVAHIGYDAFNDTYSGERMTIGLGFMTLVMLGVNVDRLVGGRLGGGGGR